MKIAITHRLQICKVLLQNNTFGLVKSNYAKYIRI